MGRPRPQPGKIRVCRHCGTSGLEGEVFYLGQGNCCKQCSRTARERHRKEVQAEAGERHERRKEQMRLASAKRKWGLSAEEARRLYAIKACEICGRDENVRVNGRMRRLSIDHCHRTGIIRGLLCTRCNRAIGLFGDDIDLLVAAIGYLRRFAEVGMEGQKP